jgi:L-lactate dehydrogenase (cytochrome)/(S)-mandelate dehydrogenase
VGGEAGVAHVLEIYRREIDRTMGLCGVKTVGDIRSSLIIPRRKLEHSR